MGIIGNKEGDAKTTKKDERLTSEKAREIIIDWLKARKFRENKIDLLDDLIQEFADSMVNKDLRLNDDGLFEYKLLFPMKDGEGETYLEKIVLKDRIDYRGVKPHMSKIKNADTAGQLMAYACGLSGLHMNELQKLDTRDSGFLRNYAALFF